jgi:DNA-directed RNA polymerase specialized sigma24 family protein
MFDYAKKRMNEIDAADIVQNVFLKLMGNPDWLRQIISVSDKPEKVRVILFIFIRNECNDFYRRTKNTNKIFEGNIQDFETIIFTNPEQEYQNVDLINLLIDDINGRDDLNRDIFIKYYIEG